MISFSLDHQSCTLVNLNTRAELHGEDREPAADLKLSWTTGNDLLAEFHPSLRSALFREPDANDVQPELLDEAGALSKVRFPQLGALKWDASIIGAEVVVHYGTSGKSDIVLGEATVDGFSFDLQDGGSVTCTMRVRCHPDEKQIGKLYTLIQREVEVSITPPEADEKLKEAA